MRDIFDWTEPSELTPFWGENDGILEEFSESLNNEDSDFDLTNLINLDIYELDNAREYLNYP